MPHFLICSGSLFSIFQAFSLVHCCIGFSRPWGCSPYTQETISNKDQKNWILSKLLSELAVKIEFWLLIVAQSEDATTLAEKRVT